jgi:hypothetical protein
MEAHGLRMFGNKVLRGIYGPERGRGIVGVKRESHNL